MQGIMRGKAPHERRGLVKEGSGVRYIRGMFVRVAAWDHWEEYDPEEEGYVPSGTGESDPSGAEPFIVQGQLVKVTATHIWIEGQWTFLSNGEVSHGTFGVVRSTIRHARPIRTGECPPSCPYRRGRSPGPA